MLARSILGSSLLLLSIVACTTEDPEPQGDTTGSTTVGDASQGGSTGGSTQATEPPGEPSYCPGVPEWGYPVCRTGEDCEDAIPCVPGPDDCPGPGCPSDCENDAECVDFGGPGIDGVCTFPQTGCCASSGLCAAPCDQTGCAADETCEADGHCTPIPCDGGYACAEGFGCDPGSAGADRHGCAAIPCDQAGALPCGPASECVAGVCQRIACSVDSDCPCGTCIVEECWDRPWVCDEGNA